MEILALRRTGETPDVDATWHLLDGTPVRIGPTMLLYQGGSRYLERIASDTVDAVAASSVLIELLGGWSAVSELLPRARRGGAS